MKYEGLEIAEGRPQTQIACKDKEHLFCRNNGYAGVGEGCQPFFKMAAPDIGAQGIRGIF